MSSSANDTLKPQSIWDKILTSTPVALTVLATLLAGLSSSEMTQAQYHRSLAAQNQSKAGDEWAFFQARRQRITTARVGAEQFQAHALDSPVTPESLTTSLDELTADVRSAGKQGKRLGQALDAARAQLGEDADDLVKQAGRFADRAEGWTGAAEKLREHAGKLQSDGDFVRGVGYLATNSLPSANGEPAGDPRQHLRDDLQAINPGFADALAAVAAHRPESELAPLVARISHDDLRRAIETVETRAKDFDAAAEPVTAAHVHAAELTDEAQALANAVRQEGAGLRLRAANLPATDAGPVQQLRQALATTADLADALRTRAAQRDAAFRAARLRYEARRHEHETRYNLTAAGLHELQVRKNSLASDTHRRRSQWFFFSMLAAQAGVTVATLALAVRYGSMLWGLAALAGLAALGIAAYAYVSLWV